MTPSIGQLQIRTAHRAELDLLNELILRSKAVWGYDEAFLAACKDELRLRRRDLKETSVAIAESDSRPLGVVQVKTFEQEAELLKLFIAPEAMGTGTGRALFKWACGVALEDGAESLVIDSDPDAAPFYRHMGACDIGLAPSGSIPGRMLPMLAYALK
ncbi:MAG: GNAT family N-acetyltransferase [Rhizobiales bacterium]|nr:GNAT family N-acetyltransferase [Hyphomicrobiales bacterium]